MSIRVDRTTENGEEVWRATLRVRPRSGPVSIEEAREMLSDAEGRTTAELHRLAGAKGAEFYGLPEVTLRATTGGIQVTAMARVVPKD